MVSLLLFFVYCNLVCLIYSQYAPHMDKTLECDSTITDRFLEGQEYYGVTRYYSLTTSYDTVIPRDVHISTCVLSQAVNQHEREMAVYIEDNGDLRNPYSPNYITAAYDTDSCDSGYTGLIYRYRDLPAGQYIIGIRNLDYQFEGGVYKVSVACYNPHTPSPVYVQNNATTFPYLSDWVATGSKDISCGLTVTGQIDAGINTYDWYKYTVTAYATEIQFSTCGSSIQNRMYNWYYWPVPGARGWDDTDSNGYTWCNSLQADGWDDDTPNPPSSIYRVAVGEYYISVQSFSTGRYVLNMECWTDNTVLEASTYNLLTPSPITPTTTGSPTPAPTNVNTTYAPTPGPTDVFNPDDKKDWKMVHEGDISCGIYKHGKLKKKHYNYYKFEVDPTGYYMNYYSFDTCLNDQTKFFHCITIYQYFDSILGDWWQVQQQCQYSVYCNALNVVGTLSPGKYVVVITGTDKNEYGDYILRMGCDLINEDVIPSVDSTDPPTPAPTGDMDIEERDDEIVGDISCGVTLQGSLDASEGHFHEFRVTKKLDWVKFDTCDDTEFANYLFIYNYFNLTGHEEWNWLRDNSYGFHAEEESTCNEMQLNDVTPGNYYVLIEGYNYYFDYGKYTIHMECSDDSAVAGASNYEEYGTGMEWWIILIIVLAILLVIVIIIIVICCIKRRGSDSGGNDAGADGGGENMQMATTGQTHHE